ncbi:hypothetical protein ACV3P7_03160 [Clostridium perfringens]
MDFLEGILGSKEFKFFKKYLIIALILIAILIVIDFNKGQGKYGEVVASCITGIFTLGASLVAIFTIVNTWNTSKEKNLIEVITKNRAEWVKEMKLLFSDYFNAYDNSKNKDKLIKIRNSISLRLNPNGKIDNEILKDLDILLNKKDKNLRYNLEIKVKLYLKCEWERIKFETREGLKEYNFEREFKKIKSKNCYINKTLISNEKIKKFKKRTKRFNKTNIKC